ncbi:OmpA family protein [Variovorax sp. 770b2]|uniref:OmpA family protein n=1 Tax=Variovorax sp. 770b2 TaxID=1566271 RepID=UPI0008E8DC10|nr:OmpA family protein [Variovorax sp. 770b2]SFQ43137.1 Outer membrane protein OmpA [Variovorax sp. 770b2]
MRRLSKIACSSAAALACASALAQQSPPPVSGPIPAKEYWTAKAQCWADLAVSEKYQGDTRNTAKTAADNAQRIRSALSKGLEPTSADEQPIHAREVLPSLNSRNGRAAWRSDIEKISAAVFRYHEHQCRTPRSACLEVALESVWENMEETQGARWNHGRPEIDAALRLASGAVDDLSQCDPPPEPIPVTDLPRAIPQRSLSADVLFAFDSADLTLAGERAVTAVAKELGRDSGSRFRVVGHTDLIGKAAYNQRLSERRAAAVKRVLQESLPDASIDSAGVGSSMPIVTCSRHRDAKTIACLAPNRRVVIQVLP